MLKGTQLIAQDLIDKGFSVVPIIKGKKQCKDQNWQNLIFTADLFEPEDNIGIKSIDGIVVVDIDSKEAVALADSFLPKTNTIWGRKSKPRSKRIFRSKFEKIEPYKDLHKSHTGGGVIVELRVSHQDVCPNSQHACGEILEWVEPPTNVKNVTEIEPNLLRRAVRALTTAALIARHYPQPGNRHDWGLALIGVLRKLELDEKEAYYIFEKVGKYIKDDKIQDRLDAVRSTYSHAEDEPLKATGALTELATPEFVQSLNKIWGIGKHDLTLIENLNKIHAIINQQSGEHILITTYPNEQPRFSKLNWMTEEYPEMITYDVTKTGILKKKKLGAIWLSSSKRRRYRGIELAPDGNLPSDYYNMWRGWKVEPKQGKWELFKSHIKDVVANNNEEIYNYILAWMANVVQHPEKQGYTAIILRGEQGVGKSTFAEWFGSLFGTHFLELNSSGQLTGRFNAHFHNSIFVFADEAVWVGDRAGIGALRRMITQDTLAIERKGIDILTVKNRVHLMIASNNKYIIQAVAKERRFNIFDLSNEHQNDAKWFKAIHRELYVCGGREAMLYDLLRWQSKVDLRMIIDTPGLRDQKIRTLDYIQVWWLDKLETGILLSCESEAWPKEVSYAALHLDYCEFTDKHFRSQRTPKSTQVELGTFLRKFAPGKKQQRHLPGTRSGERREMYRVIPSFDICIKIWEEETKIMIEGETQG